jgi:hypothetical protein
MWQYSSEGGAQMKKIHSVALGQAGIHRVVSELIIRGFCPFSPAFDTEGVDVMLREGVRIQVKTTALHQYSKDKQPSYNFELRSTSWTGANRKMLRTKRDFEKECDFIVLWGVDEDKLWVIPSRVLNGKGSIRISPESRLLKANVPALKLDRASGLSYAKLAEKHKLSVQVVWDRLHDNPDPQHGKIVKLIREHEDRWDLIESFIQTMSVDQVPQEAAKPLEVDWNIKS